jgi:hypothetical protein
MRLVIGETRPATSLVGNEILRQRLRALTGAERRLLGKLPILEKNTKKATKMVDIFVLMFGVSELPNSLKLQIVIQRTQIYENCSLVY